MPGFVIDEKKLRGALPAPSSSALEDLKWSGAAIGLFLGVIGWAGFVGWLLLRALP